MQEGDVENILFARQVNQVLQGIDILPVAAAEHQAFMPDGVTCGFGAELIGIILEPGESLENAVLEDREWLAGNPCEVALEGKCLQPGRIVNKCELIREHLLAHFVFTQERETTLDRATVETDPVHKTKHFGGGG